MTRRVAMGLSLVALLAVVVSVAWAQGGWGRGRGCGLRWQTASPADQQRVADLHRQIRQGQWDLFAMQQSGADPEKIAGKQKEIAGLRDQLHNVMVATRPATCPRAGRPIAGQGAGPLGTGCPWGNQPGAGCPWGVGPGGGLGGRWGCGMGMGRGMGMGIGGRWGGVCPWTPPPAASAPAEPQ